MNKTIKRNVVISALLAIMLCVSLIAGATFALFTSESKVNIAVTSGKVDVKASLGDLTLYSPTKIDYDTGAITDKTNAANATFANGGTAVIDGNTLTLTNVTPGDKATVIINVTNDSNVTVQYRTILACESDNGLFSALTATVAGEEYNGATKVSAWKTITAGTGDFSFDVEIELPTTAGNDYQNKTCKLSYTVEAVQGNAETSEPDPDTYYVYTAMDLVNFDKKYDTMAIMNDIDMTGYAWNAIYDLALTIEGRGHKIIGLSGALLYTEGGANITINNLTIDKANILGNSSETTNGLGIAAFVAYMDVDANLTMNNCTVSNSTITAESYKVESGEPRAAALVGYISSGSAKISNCKVENCTITSDNGAAGILAHTFANVEISNCSVTGNTSITCKENRESGAAKAGYLVSTVNAGTTTITKCTVGENVKLSNNNAKAPVANGLVGRVAGGVLIIDNTVYCQSAYLANILTASKSVSLDKDYVILDDWTAISILSTFRESAYAPTVDSYAINGNDHSISGLTSALFDAYAVGSMKIENLTIKDSKIVGNGGGWAGCGAFIMYKDSVAGGSITMTNCHLLNSSVTSNGTGTGALIGYVSGTALNMTNCSAENCEINGAGHIGGLIGHCQLDSGKTYIVENCKVEKCTFTSSETENYIGQIAGCINGATDGVFTIKDCTYIGTECGRPIVQPTVE